MVIFWANGFLKKSQITSIIEGGIEYSKPQDVATAFNSFCASVGRNTSNSFDSDNHYTASSPIVNSFYFKLTTESEIFEVVEALKDKQFLCKIINRCLLTGNFPSLLNTARAVPTYKSGEIL